MKKPNAKKNLRPLVLVVEDDESIVSMLKYNLEKAGYDVVFTHDGEEASYLVEENHPDVILLDWMLPGKTGVQICHELRAKPETKSVPIIMLSARGEEGDRVEGLDRGADDYLVKPFSPRELLSRINALFRRARPVFAEAELTFGPLVINRDNHHVLYAGREVSFSPIEYKIVQSLLEYPRRVLSREQLLRRVWGADTQVDSRTIDVHINRIRKVFDSVQTEEALVVKTVRSVGYSLRMAKDGDSDQSVAVSDNEIAWEE